MRYTDDEFNHAISLLPKIVLNSDNIPQQFRHLMGHAQKWGTLDVHYMGLLERTGDDELTKLIEDVTPYYLKILDDWLTDAESSAPHTMSKEYIAFTDLLSAVEMAEIELEHRKKI